MGYLFSSIALLCGAAKGYLGKRISGYAEGTRSAVLLNLVRMAFCIVLSLVLMLVTGDVKAFTLDGGVVLVSALSGIATAFFVVSWLLAVRKSAYMMLDVFLMLGTLVPIISGHILFSESIVPRQWLGFILLLAAVFIMCSYNNSIKGKLTHKSVLLLVACGIANGATSVSQKIFVKSFSEIPITLFNFYTYVFAAMTLAVVFFLMSKEDRLKFDKAGTKRALICLAVMALALTLHSYFTTIAAIYLDSARLYPFAQGGGLVLATVMSAVFFGEKLTLRASVGIILSFISLLIINL